MRKREKAKIEELYRKKTLSRWVVALVFIGTTLGSLWFWWIGHLGKEVQEMWQPRPVVWDAAEQHNQQPTTSNQQLAKVDTNELRGEIEKVIAGLQGTYIVYAKSLDGSAGSPSTLLRTYWELEVGNSSEIVQAASLIKLPVMVAVYRLAERGEIDLDSVYKLKDADRVGGSGSLVGKPVGYEITVRKLLWHMGNESDNTAFQAVVNLVGTEKLQEEFLKMGLPQVSIANNEIIPKEIAKLLEWLSNYKYINKQNSKELLATMVKTWYEDRIPAGVPEAVKVAHKVGTEIGVVSDAGIIYADQPYLLVIMTEGVKELEAKKVVPEISQVVWELNDKLKVKN